MEKIIYVHITNISEFNTKLAEINKKLSKKNLPLINAEIMEKADADNKFTSTFKLTSEFNQTNIKGVDATYEGVVDLVNQNENDKVYHVNNSTIKFLTDCKCDECQKKIGRNKYIVFKKSSEIKSREDLIVLGTSCTKNYFPFDIEKYFSNLDYDFTVLGDFDEFEGSMSTRKDSYSLTMLFNATRIATNNFAVYEKEGCTKEKVLEILNLKKENIVYPKIENEISYSDMIAWIEESFNTDSLTNFDLNIRSAFYFTDSNGKRILREYIPIKVIGIAIYGFISAKNKHESKVKAEKSETTSKEITYFEAIGDKFEKELIFDKIFEFESGYGYSYILLFHDNENHVFKWVSSNCNYKLKDDDYYAYESDKTYLMKGSIKSHAEYKGTKQTVITRCKVVKVA